MADNPERGRPQEALAPEDQPTHPTTRETGKRAAPDYNERSPTKRRKPNEETTETAEVKLLKQKLVDQEHFYESQVANVQKRLTDRREEWKPLEAITGNSFLQRRDEWPAAFDYSDVVGRWKQQWLTLGTFLSIDKEEDEDSVKLLESGVPEDIVPLLRFVCGLPEPAGAAQTW
jgi:hypothetical protein